MKGMRSTRWRSIGAQELQMIGSITGRADTFPLPMDTKPVKAVASVPAKPLTGGRLVKRPHG